MNEGVTSCHMASKRVLAITKHNTWVGGGRKAVTVWLRCLARSLKQAPYPNWIYLSVLVKKIKVSRAQKESELK